MPIIESRESLKQRAKIETMDTLPFPEIGNTIYHTLTADTLCWNDVDNNDIKTSIIPKGTEVKLTTFPNFGIVRRYNGEVVGKY